jgi:predicted RND superfamily exporter protein
MARYYEQVDAGAPPDELVVRAFQRVWLPLVVSAVTVAIGFGSLVVNRIVAIRDLGVFAVVGVLLLTVPSLTFLPAALSLMRVHRRSVRSGRVGLWLSSFLGRLGERAYESRRTILVVAAVVALLALTGIRRIRVDSDFLYYFDPSSEVRIANETINREIVGSNPFYLAIEGGTPGKLKRWEVLKEIKDLQVFLLKLPGITSSLSLVDYLELLEKGLAKGGEGDLVLDEHGNPIPVEAPKSFWEDPAGLTPVLNIVSTSPETFRSVVTKDFRRANVLVRTNLSGSQKIEETLGRIRGYIGEHFPAEIQVQPTGNLVLLTGTTSDIVAGQIESLSIALGVIFMAMALMFLSARVGFLAMLPNVLSIIVFFGVIGFLGIFLNIGTSLIAAIALGIAVDLTIHYMARLNLELQGEAAERPALIRTSRIVGVPIVFAAVALFFGFLTFAFSSFVPIQNFGILTGVTIATALVANLVLLPALLATTKIISLWDLLRIKLGESPERTIALFAGLRRSQIRIVVLMGRLKRFRTGEPIVRRGEEGDEMFVVIQGTAEVSIGEGTDRRRIDGLRRGDVVGEMGLVRHERRTADVVAVEDIEVLAVDERFLKRIQSRYPRIAARVFLNLNRILSDRLQRANERLVAQGRQ